MEVGQGKAQGQSKKKSSQQCCLKDRQEPVGQWAICHWGCSSDWHCESDDELPEGHSGKDSFQGHEWVCNSKTFVIHRLRSHSVISHFIHSKLVVLSVWSTVLVVGPGNGIINMVFFFPWRSPWLLWKGGFYVIRCRRVRVAIYGSDWLWECSREGWAWMCLERFLGILQEPRVEGNFK